MKLRFKLACVALLIASATDGWATKNDDVSNETVIPTVTSFSKSIPTYKVHAFDSHELYIPKQIEQQKKHISIYALVKHYNLRQIIRNFDIKSAQKLTRDQVCRTLKFKIPGL
jgi:hypothetical protein